MGNETSDAVAVSQQDLSRLPSPLLRVRTATRPRFSAISARISGAFRTYFAVHVDLFERLAGSFVPSHFVFLSLVVFPWFLCVFIVPCPAVDTPSQLFALPGRCR